MSGIYIKGMEMPTNCDSCRIMVFEDTNCVPELFCGCPIVFKAHPQGKNHRPDYCPLVEIPDHGRLIDADALPINNPIHSMMIFGGEIVIAKSAIDNAPTIIPADKEGGE